MTPTVPPGLDLKRTQALYELAEQRYLEALPLEHFMESTPHATQRKITLESFDLIHAKRADIQCFNELLVQYPPPGQDPEKPAQVVPDNMVVIHSQPIQATGSFNTPLQPARPFLMLEYVSKSSKRKDYDDNYTKYEQDLQVPYYLTFYPDADEMTLYRLKEQKYHAVRPNEHGRYPIAELELEAALHEGWVRFWFRGKLLPLPAELQRELDLTQSLLKDTQNQLNVTQNQLSDTRNELIAAHEKIKAQDQAQRDVLLELAKLREQLARATQPE
jgi:Uma2 family endonuclease